MKKYLVSILLLCFAAMAFAQKNTGRVIIPESNLEFKANSDYTEVTITGFKYSSYSENKKFDGRVIEIPSKIQGVPVTAIGREAFTYKGDGISGLWIPDSVKDIGSYAFQCAYFGSIRLPEGLKTITTGMLNSCRTKSVTIPSSVTKISSWAFSDSEIESVSIPKGCTIVGGSGDSMAAFQNCSKLKSVTFPSGRVYFDAKPIDPDNNWAWSGEGIFRNCDSLVNISIPKGFEAVYRSEYDFADHTLADYISGKKLSENFSAQKALKSVKVRNAAVVDHEAYLAAYNQALKSGDYTRAMLLAKQYKEYYPYYKSSEWTAKYNEAIEKPYLDAYNKALASKDYNKAIQLAKEFKEKNPSVNTNEWTKRYTDIAEKTYLDEYNKAMASKDWEKAKKIINEFMGKISSDSSLSSLESKWNGMLLDIDCTRYLPAYVEMLEKKGSVAKVDSNLQFKIPLTNDLYESPSFNFTDSEGNGLWTVGYTLFLRKIKEFTGKDYQIYDNYSNSYLYRDATAEESSAYYQVRKDAVKQFMESAVNASVIEKDGLNSLYKIYLADNIYSYRKDAFSITDASGNVYTISEDDFLNYVKEVCGTEYKLCGSYYSNYSYLYRNATEAELAAYHQVRKDAVKQFMEEAVKKGTVEKDNSNLLFKIYLSDSTYSYSNSKFTVKDASGDAYTLSDKDFLSYAKEVCGTEYKLNVSYYSNSSYLYRNATEAELAAYHQVRKDAVKYFMEEAVKKGTVEKDSSNLLFKIYLSDSTYSYSNSKFTVKDASGDAYTLSDKDFLSYAKEVCGTEYKLNVSYYSNSSYLYRNATEAELAAYHQPRKDAVKQFMEEAVKKGTVEKDNSNFLFKIYLSDSTYSYSNNKFTVKDASGDAYTLSDKDFLSYAKEVFGTEYKLNVSYYSNSSYLYRNATEAELAAYHQPRKDAVKQFMEEAVKKGTVEKNDSNFVFKTNLSKDVYSYTNSTFTVKNASGTAYTLSDKDFLSYAKEVCGTEYKLYGSASYLYRNATAEEIAAYHQPRKDAVKYFMDGVAKDAKFEMDNKQLMFKIYFPNETYSHRYSSVTVKDSSGKDFTFGRGEFLDYVKEACGTQYWIYANDSHPYIYRNATEEEIATYHNQRKEAVKLYMDESIKNGVVEMEGSKYLFNIPISNDVYGGFYNRTFTLKDSSGNAYVLANEIFLGYVKEIYGTEYDIYNIYDYGNYVSSYFSRNATAEEISAYHQSMRDIVKYFIDEAAESGTVEYNGSNFLFKIYLSSSTCRDTKFSIKDASGNAYTLYGNDFLSYAKEACGVEYKLYGSYYYSDSTYLYRNATKEEIAEYHQVRKDAVKQFMERAVNVGVIEKDGSNLLFKIYLSESTYRNSKFTIKDSSGKAYTLSNDDFLSYAKETSGIDYKLSGSYRDPYLYAKANDMLQLKCVFAFQNGNLHTNLVYKLKDKWEFPVEFAESNDTVTVKSFKVKKSVFEENGLKAKDVVKKIVVSDAYGNETEIGWKDLPNVQAPSTLLITVVRGSGKKAQTYIVKVPVEWDVDEMKSIKDILDFKCILAFQNGTLHTNLACNVDGKWMYVAEFVESKGEVIIKSFRAKKSVLERVGLKTKDIIKKVVLIDDSENEIAVVNNLFEIQAPATLRFTVERGSGKKAQTMIFDVPVEWNEDEVKNLR